MWIARLLPLFLALVVIPDRGTSQIGAQVRRCADCPKILLNEEPAWRKKVIDGNVSTYINCSHLDSIRYQWKSKVICAKRTLSWVKELMKCLDGDRKCLTDASSSSQKEFSKGTNVKPATTTVNVPTTTPMATMKPSTQSRDDNIGQSTEPAKHGATTPPANDRSTKLLDSNKANINLAQGNDQPSEDSNGEVDGKMKHMKTAIISLVTIVLVLVAVSVGLFCRKRRANKFNTPCGSGSIEYVAAPSQDSVNVE